METGHDRADDPSTGRGRPRRVLAALGLAGLVLAGILVLRNHVFAAPEPAPRPAPAVPVTVAAARQQNVPVYLNGLGIIQASRTVSIRPQVDGQLVAVDFVQGQDVHAGDVLARIDPRPFQATLDQAKARKAQDEAQLVGARKDLARFKSLAAKSFESQQNVDQQQTKVDQLAATVQADDAAIESAELQLSYTSIKAPFDGRIGIRQVDAGNIVHASDPTPIAVLTRLRPAYATFSLPQKDLAAIRDALLKGPVPVTAFDQNDADALSQGHLLLVDNQIEQSTGTIKLRATFDNADERLWPGESVHVRTQAAILDSATTVPFNAVQQGPDGAYVWTVKADNTAARRPVTTGLTTNETAVVTKGLSPGEAVVVDGQYRLEEGVRVAARPADDKQAANAPNSPAAARP